MRSLAPIKLPGFSHLAGAYAVNELGNWIGEIALAVLVYDQTGSPLATAALFLGMQFAPGFLGQVLVARVEPAGTKRMLPLLYLAEAATFVALAATADNFALWLVVLLAAVDGTLAIGARALTRAAAAAVLKPHGLLREGNAIINVGFTGAGAIGPLLAGVAVATLGIETALLLDAASFVLVAAALAAATSLPQVKAQPERWWARLGEGFSYVNSQPVLRRLMTMQAAAFVFFSLVLPIEIVYAKETLDAGDSGYGALLSAWGVGMVFGSFVFLAGRRVADGDPPVHEHSRGLALIPRDVRGRDAGGGVCGRGPGRRRQRRAVGGGDEHRPGTHRRAVPGTGRGAARVDRGGDARPRLRAGRGDHRSSSIRGPVSRSPALASWPSCCWPCRCCEALTGRAPKVPSQQMRQSSR